MIMDAIKAEWSSVFGKFWPKMHGWQNLWDYKLWVWWF